VDVSLLAAGCAIEWSATFREAMAELCSARGVRKTVPAGLSAAPLRSEGILLVWPRDSSGPGIHPVRVTPAGRRITTDLAGPLAELGVALPHGIVIDVPVGPYYSPKYGHCLALFFPRATFLYRRSKGSAIGQQD
jgi:hypothetical protein